MKRGGDLDKMFNNLLMPDVDHNRLHKLSKSVLGSGLPGFGKSNAKFCACGTSVYAYTSCCICVSYQIFGFENKGALFL